MTALSLSGSRGEADERFGHVCCETIEVFRRETKAITRAGQIKGKGQRHEKDDRTRIDDRTNYVLGWSNEAKIAALDAQIQARAKQCQKLAMVIAALDKEKRAISERTGQLQKLSAFTSFCRSRLAEYHDRD